MKIFFFYLIFHLKKNNQKTLNIGKIKYPKLASIILLLDTAYIQESNFKN